MSSAPIRVLVVDDSLTVRKHIVEVLTSAPGLEVVGEAADGKQAIEVCQRVRPDVITMDMILPVMTGLAATEYIMAYCPTPILIVSASTNRGELFKTYDALAAGAVDVLDKAVGPEPDDAWEGRLVAAVRMVSRIRVITHPRARLGGMGVISKSPGAVRMLGAQTRHRLVAIGASTGGPAALLTVLGGLPRTFSLPILVVLHISDPFGVAMAEWLSAQLPFEVRCARDGEPIPAPGRCSVLLAPAGTHLEVAHGRLRLTLSPERHSCRPSVDALFESLARDFGHEVIACLLTGMGKDGADGLLAIRHAGGVTLAQDETTSVVFGMPAEAIRLGAASSVLKLQEFASVLERLAGVVP